MAANEHTSDDTTRVADEPGADYFRPLKQQAVEQQSASTAVADADDPKCNCGAKPGCAAAECVECKPAAEQRAEAAESQLAENLQDAVVEMISHAREQGDTEFVSAVMDALNDEIGVIRDRLQAEIDDNRQRAETAEQRAANIETRTAVKLGEFAKLVDVIDAECKRLGIQWHGSVSTTLKAIISRTAAPAQPAKPETGKGSPEESYICGGWNDTPFTTLLKHVRLRDGHGLRAFAERIGMLPSDFAAIQNGRVEPTDDDVAKIISGLSPAPSPHVATGGQEANVREIITQAVTDAMRLIYVAGHGAPVTPEDRDQIIDDAVRAIQPQAEIESQLAKLKQQAEAWEAIIKYGISVGHGGGMACDDAPVRMMYWIGGHRRTDFASKREAATRMRFIASQLSASQADQDGKEQA